MSSVNGSPLRAVSYMTMAGFLLALLMTSGCAGLGRGQSFAGTARSDLIRVTGKKQAHLVHVAVKTVTPERNRRVGTMIFKTPASTQTAEYTGITVADGNYVLVPAKLDQDSMKDVSVWIGEEDSAAAFIAYEKQLGMSIIQIKTDKRLPVLSLTPRSEAPSGQWLAVANTSGENDYFMPRTGLYMVCGRRPTFYPELVIDGIGVANRGAPLLDRRARPVAIVTSPGTAVALSEAFCADLSLFINKSSLGEPEDEEDDQGRLGICLQPINKDHAKFLGVDRSSLWVTHVLPDSAAAKAGLRNGDLIVAFDGEPLRYSGDRTRKDFNWRLAGKKLDPFSLTVWRDGETLTRSCRSDRRPEPVEFQSEELGVVVREIDENAYAHKNLAVRDGVLVTRVLPGSPASTSSTFGKSLIQTDDVIVELNGVPTPDVSRFRKVLEDVRIARPHAVLVKYQRGRLSGYAGLNLTIGSISNGAAQ
ncbi:MAG: PDZ domain-containing protein [Lentisphaeria bacterium]|nr:PDZ domain-containing protein [Lentisphaeria bacterium]